jgi:hypothetical protein
MNQRLIVRDPVALLKYIRDLRNLKNAASLKTVIIFSSQGTSVSRFQHRDNSL